MYELELEPSKTNFTWTMWFMTVWVYVVMAIMERLRHGEIVPYMLNYEYEYRAISK